MLRSRFGIAVASVVFAAVLFGILEIFLAALDVGRGQLVFRGAGDPFTVQYLYPDEKTPGGWKTQFESKKQKDIFVGPKGEAQRFVFLGASNTHSFRTTIAHEYLVEASGGAPWEVINLGRGGYGSQRVMVMALEVIEKLEPDAILIYTGDNDFHDLAGFGSSSLLIPDTRNDLRVYGSRTIGLLREVLAANAGYKPQPWVAPPQERLAMLSLEETRSHQEQTRKNLTTMLEAARAKDVHVVLCSILYNRFAPPSSMSLRKNYTSEQKREFSRLMKEAQGLIPESLASVLPDRRDALVLVDWKRVKKRPQELPDIDPLAWRRPAQEPLAGMLIHNREPWEWGPKAWKTVESLGHLKARDFSAEDQKKLERMEGLLTQQLEICADHPPTHWMLGIVSLALGHELATAEHHLVSAADFDRSPKMGTRTLNKIIREVAAAHPEVLFMDIDKRTSSLVEGAIVGYEWMLDHCHMTLGARHLLLKEMAQAYCERWPVD